MNRLTQICAKAFKSRILGPRIQDSFAKAYKRGVKIAFGTDVGVGARGTNAIEFIRMARAGITPMDCIKSVNAADLCGIADQVGTIENGKTADIIAVAGDPLEDVGVLGNVDFVMARGKVFED